MKELSVFLAQFFTIYLLGIQQKNVIGGHYFLAFITSVILGVIGWYLTSIISSANLQSVGSSVWFSFVIAGPLAIMLAMKTHSWIIKRLQ